MVDRDAADSTASGPSAATANAAEWGIERARGIVIELIEASWSAAQAGADEQKQRAADEVANVGEAVRQAAQSLARSGNPNMAQYTAEAADQIDRLAQTVRERGWQEIVGDVEGFARREPALFVALSVAAGFLAGRFLWAPVRRPTPAPGEPAAEAAGAASPPSVSEAPAAASGDGEAAAAPGGEEAP